MVGNTYTEKIAWFVMVVGSLTKYLIYGLIGAFAITALADPKRAFGATQAFGGVGSALGSLGTGIQSLFTGIGTGGAQLFNPLWTLKDLIFSPQAGVQTPTDIREIASTQNPRYEAPQKQQYQKLETDIRSYPQGEQPIFQFGFNPQIDRFQAIAPVTVHGQNLPLTQTAIDYYEGKGVTVSPSSNQTVASSNSQNATSAAAGQVGSPSYAVRGGSAAASAAAAALSARARA